MNTCRTILYYFSSRQPTGYIKNSSLNQSCKTVKWIKTKKMAGVRKRQLSSDKEVSDLKRHSVLEDNVNEVDDMDTVRCDTNCDVFSVNSKSNSTPKNSSNMAETLELILKKLQKLDNLDKLQSDVSSIKDELSAVVQSLEYTQKELDSVKGTVIKMEKEMDTLKKVNSSQKSEISQLQEKNRVLEQRIIKQEQYSRQENIIVSGLEEKEKEDCTDVARKLLRMVDLEPDLVIQRCHRIGKRNPGHSRKLIVRFLNYADKVRVMKNAKLLKGKDIYIADDYPPEVLQQHHILRPVLKKAKITDPKASIVDCKIRYKNTLYSKSDLEELLSISN